MGILAGMSRSIHAARWCHDTAESDDVDMSGTLTRTPTTELGDGGRIGQDSGGLLDIGKWRGIGRSEPEGTLVEVGSKGGHTGLEFEERRRGEKQTRARVLNREGSVLCVQSQTQLNHHGCLYVT